jgi:uridine kinase
MSGMKKLLIHPLFLLGLFIRLGLIVVVLPFATVEWYAPFMDVTTSQFSLDPWGVFLDQGGAPAAFPYGYVMWLAFLPLTVLIKLLGVPVLYGYGLTLLVADFVLLLVLKKMLPNRDNLLLAAYWLSPIILLATYWYGFNDLIPVLLLVMALHFTRQLKFFHAGALCAAAISAKLSMILVVPFFLIYLIRNRALGQLLPTYLAGGALFGLLFGLPFLFSDSGLHMLLSNPEMGKVYQFSLAIGNSIFIYVIPMVYLVMLYAAWRVRRLNYELFHAILGMAFLLVVLLTPASPGWFIWVMPLLISYQAISGRVAIGLVGLFSALYVLSSLLLIPASALTFSVASGFWSMDIASQANSHLKSILHTGITAIGVVLALRIWRESVSFNDYFRLSRKPFAIGISGDSGSGKDTLVDALEGLFGSHSVARLSGDDYHLWDRQKPMWQVMTHLNPMTNDLDSFANDLIALTDDKPIVSHHYDHVTGKKSRPFQIKSNDFIIASGLHALYLPLLRDSYNLSIYLDMDDSLRRHLKLQRDIEGRGLSLEQVTSSLAMRESDSVKFIRPQAEHADLVMSLQPIHPRMLEKTRNGKHPLRYKLFVQSRNGLNVLSLSRVLVGVCGLHVDIGTKNKGSEVELTIEGETSAEDVELAAKMLFPRVLEFLDISPKWQNGIEGIMQLITLSHVNQALNKRLI